MLTSNKDFSSALCFAERVESHDFVFTVVSRSDSENVHGAHAARVGDVVIFVRVDADIVQVPGHTGCGAPTHGTGHVQLVTFGWAVDFQRDQN